jgi:hypothetical protein
MVLSQPSLQCFYRSGQCWIPPTYVWTINTAACRRKIRSSRSEPCCCLHVGRREGQGESRPIDFKSSKASFIKCPGSRTPQAPMMLRSSSRKSSFYSKTKCNSLGVKTARGAYLSPVPPRGGQGVVLLLRRVGVHQDLRLHRRTQVKDLLRCSRRPTFDASTSSMRLMSSRDSVASGWIRPCINHRIIIFQV